MKQRIEYIDAVKAFAIILMVVGHCHWIGAIPKLYEVIYIFHMPIFFVIAGMFIKPQTLLAGGRKYARLYLKPYFITCVIFLALQIVNSFIHGNDINIVLLEWIKQTSFGSGWSYGYELFATTPAIGCIWFLFALFWAELFYSLIKRIDSSLERGLWVFGLFLFAVVTARHIRLPFSLQPGMSAVLFLWVGDMIIRYNVIDKATSISPIAKITFVMFAVMASLVHNPIGAAVTYFSPELQMIPASIICCVAIFVIFKHFNFRGGWIGKNTLCILCGHKLAGSFFSIIGYKSSELTFITQINFVIELSVSLTVTLLLGFLLYKSTVLK